MKKRKSNIELLRIVMILMVILNHYLNGDMGGLLNYTQSNTPNYYLGRLLYSMCVVAVNVFVIITGYFSYSKKEVKVSKVIKLILIMIFYGVLLCTIAIVFNKLNITHLEISMSNIVENIFSQWFVIIYVALYLNIPFINLIINKISKKQFEILLIINLFFFSIWPTFFTNVTSKDAGYGIVNFVILYFIGAYIRLYGIDFPVNSLWIYIITTLCTVGLNLVLDIVIKTNSWGNRAWSYSSIFNIVGSVSIFLVFKSMRLPYNKYINQLATYTFSVYIIDVNTVFNKVWYRDLFHCYKYYNSSLMIINAIYSTIGIYIICIIIEFIRRKIFHKIDMLINKINYKISTQ